MSRIRMTWLAASAALLGIVGCSPPTAATLVSVSPQAAERLVGESIQFTAVLLAGDYLTRRDHWDSDARAVATISQDGVATCHAPGTAIIRVYAEVYVGASDRAPVNLRGQARLTCREAASAPPVGQPPPPPPPPPTPSGLISVSRGSISFEHEVGTSACPQPIGGFDIRNASNETVTVEVSSNNEAIRVSRVSGAIPGGNALGIELQFDCSTQQSFTAEITITARAGTSVERKTVRVIASID